MKVEVDGQIWEAEDLLMKIGREAANLVWDKKLRIDNVNLWFSQVHAWGEGNCRIYYKFLPKDAKLESEIVAGCLKFPDSFVENKYELSLDGALNIGHQVNQYTIIKLRIMFLFYQLVKEMVEDSPWDDRLPYRSIRLVVDENNSRKAEILKYKTDSFGDEIFGLGSYIRW